MRQNLAPKVGRQDCTVVENSGLATCRDGVADLTFHTVSIDADCDRGDRLDVLPRLAQINANDDFLLQRAVLNEIGPHGLHDERHFGVHDGPVNRVHRQVLGEHEGDSVILEQRCRACAAAAGGSANLPFRTTVAALPVG